MAFGVRSATAQRFDDRDVAAGRLAGHGFSLLELVVVLSVASVLAGIGVLSHHALRPRLDLRDAARQVVMDLKVARLRTTAENVNHRIVFTDGGGTYQPQRKSGSSYTNTAPPVALPQGIVVADCTANGNATGFKPRGNAATFGTVTIRNRLGEARQIVVDIAGQVRVQ